MFDYVAGGQLSYSSGLSDTSGWNSGNRFLVADVNHDGRDDLIIRGWQGDLQFLDADANGTLWYEQCSQTISAISDANGGGNPNRLFVMDVDGDGFKDLVMRNASGNLTRWTSVQSSTCQHFVSLSTYSSTGLTDAYGYGANNRFAVLDYDGNGTDDLLVRYADGSFGAWCSTATSWFFVGSLLSTGATDASGWTGGSRLFVADVNGDGKKDIILRNWQGGMNFYTRSSSSGYISAGNISTPFSDDAAAGVGLGPNRLVLLDVVGGGGLKPLTFMSRLGGNEMTLYKSLGMASFVQE
jgi:hypothetical protein